MKYKTAAAFRQSLETRLREQTLKSGVPLARLRKMIAFDRFLARLIKEDTELWIIKGGLALQFRLGDVARTTKDIDAATSEQLRREEIIARLGKAASLQLGDWFEFEIGEPIEAATGSPSVGLRFPIQCLLDGRAFETFHLDVGQGDPIVGKPEKISGSRLLGFAGIRPLMIPCYPLASQVAEKFHAYTRPYASGGSSRVRDLVDTLLIASMGTLDGETLSRALSSTFKARSTHEVPKQCPAPPASWSGPYKKLARELNLQWSTVQEAGEAAGQFLGPVLKNTTLKKWDSKHWAWK